MIKVQGRKFYTIVPAAPDTYVIPSDQGGIIAEEVLIEYPDYLTARQPEADRCARIYATPVIAWAIEKDNEECRNAGIDMTPVPICIGGLYTDSYMMLCSDGRVLRNSDEAWDSLGLFIWLQVCERKGIDSDTGKLSEND
ncbi:hypothetical protein AX768_13370 [Burkholderia sp. PAMC 28687]|uniref:hypothetical protein n=1 Tax=Burkholderia sp. PAMC 28687 TaxID=1795874 RepID=UPI000785B6ED|nr:hypothetical protein [Burkholderia sp. PAMC 28687]AMM14939.1 hypothetical protein AX768_13370 [Burkholderia sp. PAMC 28687]